MAFATAALQPSKQVVQELENQRVAFWLNQSRLGAFCNSLLGHLQPIVLFLAPVAVRVALSDQC